MGQKQTESNIISPISSEDPGYHKNREEEPAYPHVAQTRLLRKLDARILPITCAVLMFTSLNDSSLGNARLQGLPKDILGGDPTGVLFDWLVAVFFISHVLCQIPWTVLSKYYSPRMWIGWSTIFCGVCSTLMSTANSFAGLLIARFCLGVFEAACAPPLGLYYSFYYTKAEFGTRIAISFGFSAIAAAFGGLLAYAIQRVHLSIANWRLLFIIEGVPSVLVGVLCLILLPERPESTNFLTDAERKLAIERMNRGTRGDIGAVVNKRHIIAAFLDWRIYVGGLIWFGLNCALGSLQAFLPTIIETMGYSPAVSQLMTVPPLAVATLVLLVTSYTSDRIQSRGPLIASGCTLGGIGYVILLTVAPARVHVRYLATFFITAGTSASIILLIAWLTHNLGSETKRATGVPLCAAIGVGGGVLGSHLYPLTDGPTYLRGYGVCGALMFLAAILALILAVSYQWDNARRDAAFGAPDRDAPVDTSELADKAPGFRYVP